MSNEIVSAAGERAAMGGYVNQFNEFARFAYRELVNNSLEWIKIADPEAEKLDDIQYSTHNEVHAYQVKWTIAGQTISYFNFTELVPLILVSWKALTAIHSRDKKIVIAHLLTNKLLSKHDSINLGNGETATFSNFYTEVWQKWKLGQPIAEKWNAVVHKLIVDLTLSEADFTSFVDHFEFQPEHIGVDLKVGLRLHSNETDDLLTFRSFLLEKVANPARVVPFTRQEIIDGLIWTARFKTTFNHELVVDLNRYQSISSTVDELNEKLILNTSGYIFLVGGPGSGKSTLLTEWMKGRAERVFKYYAFDFTNPSFSVNYQDRGDATNLYFDLVFQLKHAGIYRKTVLPHKDLIFLKSVFLEQLRELGQEYKKSQNRSIIVIDGLDHVPREYQFVKQSFLRDLPLPTDLPEGVFIVLGSQTYELDDLSQEIKTEWKKGFRSVLMNPMGKQLVIKYAEASRIIPTLNDHQQALLFAKSQGHPLYLSYMVERLKISEDRDETLNGFITIEGNIESYYYKIWEPIRNNAGLIEMLGLMARINDSITVAFVMEWNFPRQVLLDFRRYARVLFDESQNEWTFFHNSFRLFLLSETAVNPLSDIFDRSLDIDYHQRLASLYRSSTVEPSWKQNYHLFSSGSYDDFIAATSSEEFFSQLINFRPPNEIRSDIKLGIQIAQKDGNVPTLLHYLFSLAELDRRMFNISPASYIKEFLFLDKFTVAKRYARKGAALLISQKYALEVARMFNKFGDRIEGRLLNSLAQPEIITTDAIVLDYSKNIDNTTYSLLQEWVTSASLFQDFHIILTKIKNIHAQNLPEEREQILKPELVKSLLLRDFAFALLNQKKLDEMKIVLTEFDLESAREKGFFFNVLWYAVEANIDYDDEQARNYLKILLSHFTPSNSNDEKRIYIADLIMTLDEDKELAAKWLDGVQQPLIKNGEKLDLEHGFDEFRPLIKFNKALNLIGKGVTITAAVPASSNNDIIVEFQRMLCLITQLLCEGLEKKPIFDLIRRVQPIIQFYNREFRAHKSYWYLLTRIKTEYFDFLIRAVAISGTESIKGLVTALLNDIQIHSEYWSSEQIRGIVDALLGEEMEIEQASSLLAGLELTMLGDKDIDGRITECIRQAKSYLLLNEKGKAETWIKQCIKESIGVGYRKDYQYNTWLDWLKINIKKQPTDASKNITWFLSHLNHLKESTEGRAYESAAKKLLAITLDWNFPAGVTQMKWQLDNALIDFEDAISTFIKVLMIKPIGKHEYEILIDIYTDLYLTISVDPSISLLEIILDKGEALFEERFYTNWVQKIHKMIITKSLDEKRPQLLTAVKEFLLTKYKNILEVIPDFNIAVEPDHRRSGSSSNTLIIRPDHKSVSHEEVLSKVTGYDEFRDLLKEEDNANSSYDWTKVFKKVNTSIGLPQIREIRDIIKDGYRPTDLLILLSEKALILGDSALAEILVSDSLAHSSSSGWISFYDGGTRLKSFTALQNIKGKLGARHAFDLFCYDLLNSESVGDYAEALDEILPVITPGYDVDAVWVQLFAYLQRLMSSSKPSTNLPDLTSQDKGYYDNIIDFLVYFARYEVTLIFTAAQKILAKQLDGKRQYPLQSVASLGLDSDSDSELFLGLMLLSQEHGNDLSFFYPQLYILAKSQNFLIRMEARHLLKTNVQSLPDIEEQKLSSYYKLDLDRAQQEINRLDIAGNVRPIGQIIKLIIPLDNDLRILSKLTGIKEKLLMYRTYMFMKQVGLPDEWLAEDDGDIVKHLKEIGLTYSYKKPRVLGARRAIMKVISELIDAQQLDEEMAEKFFGPRDRGQEILSATVRPTFVERLGERKLMLDPQNWLKNIKDSPRLAGDLISIENGLKVIGEYSVLTSLDWGKTGQIFMSQIKSDTKQIKEWFIFGNVLNRQTKNYHSLTGTGDSIIVVRKETYGNFNTLSNWIAINPVLARHLGWDPHPDKIFAWNDNEGNCMVESIYWIDGNIHMQPPHLYSEAGEGWYVLATTKALSEIRKAEPNLYQEKFIYRSIENEGQSEQHMTLKELK